MSRNYDSWERLVGAVMRREKDRRLAYCESFSTISSSDDSSITADDRFELSILPWQKGELLGRGACGPVYEGFTGDGLFFAVKQVSLLDIGDEGNRRVVQLRQQIELLRKLKHENIVQCYGSMMASLYFS